MGLPGLRTGVRQFCCTARALRQTLGQHEFPAIVKNSRERHQIYVSKSLDPYLNLSIEHYLLRHSPDDARVLFLYVNRPCVVIGRNQNPWMEVDLRYIHSAHAGRKQLDLVRRRSGGGAVYHDPGNVNFSVICPIADFSRDKHAEMVVRGLRSLGVERARVNKRHDIVLDQGSEKTMVDPDDTHISPYMTSAKESRPRKISGSAYKLTRARALHHGTCLLDTNSISTLNSVFCAPGLPFIKARGVESVSSPVTNVKVSRLEFERTVTEQFCRLYSVSGAFDAQGSFKALVEESAGNLVGHELQLVPEIQEGYDELKSNEWIYQQTPQFEVHSDIVNFKFGHQPKGATDRLPQNMKFKLTAREGRIIEMLLSLGLSEPPPETSTESFEGQQIHQIQDWTPYISSVFQTIEPEPLKSLSGWLNYVFCVGDSPQTKEEKISNAAKVENN